MPKNTAFKQDPRFKMIRDDITRYFKDLGVKVRIIYRTCQEKFGEESPGNLLPAKCLNDRVSIYVDFKDNDISSENINSIIAIPEADSGNLPILETQRLPSVHPKIDLRKINRKYRFNDISDLKNNFRRIFDQE
jgi:hypothetical protein